MNLVLLVALAYLYMIVREEFDAPTARRTVLYALVFPSTLFVSAVYPHALFLAGAIPAFTTRVTTAGGWRVCSRRLPLSREICKCCGFVWVEDCAA